MSYSKPKLLSLVIPILISLAACNQESSSTAGEDYFKDNDTNTDFNQQALIINLTDNVISPTFENFLTKAELQASAVADYCAIEQSFANQTSEETAVNQAKESAKSSWREAMNVWQQAELMLLGPLIDQDGLLRDKIYSWPTVNSCAVDYDVTYFLEGFVNGQPYDITQRTPSRKGMAALEYLLFNPDLAHSCEVTAAPPNWGNLTETEQKLARCQFADEVATDIYNNANTLLTVWLADDGYANELKNAGISTSDFSTVHDAVNRISDALFYLDSRTKDAKLAKPLGYFANECGTSICPQAVEAKYSGHSLENIVNNLIGFEQLLSGKEGLGFIDYLIDVGDEETANALTADVQKAINTVNAIEDSLTDTLTNDASQIVQTHSDIKQVTDKLKTDFINSLALELPSTSAGDND